MPRALRSCERRRAARLEVVGEGGAQGAQADEAGAGANDGLAGEALPVACIVIGVTTAALCTFGYAISGIVSARIGKRAELVGGVVLIFLGARILAEHLV